MIYYILYNILYHIYIYCELYKLMIDAFHHFQAIPFPLSKTLGDHLAQEGPRVWRERYRDLKP